MARAYLLGPVREVFAAGSAGVAQRQIRRGPMAGSSFAVEVLTTLNIILTFEQASVSLILSLDTSARRRGMIHHIGPELSLHVIEVMEAIVTSAERRHSVTMQSRCERSTA